MTPQRSISLPPLAMRKWFACSARPGRTQTYETRKAGLRCWRLPPGISTEWLRLCSSCEQSQTSRSCILGGPRFTSLRRTTAQTLLDSWLRLARRTCRGRPARDPACARRVLWMLRASLEMPKWPRICTRSARESRCSVSGRPVAIGSWLTTTRLRQTCRGGQGQALPRPRLRRATPRREIEPYAALSGSGATHRSATTTEQCCVRENAILSSTSLLSVGRSSG
mmetsp:Transcript_20632/g.65826  ORF Transcript_20632/g.65826 Transcript_20632/m.65826 type:complete len:224 (-) Transcript_20632:642-1313(-)